MSRARIVAILLLLLCAGGVESGIAQDSPLGVPSSAGRLCPGPEDQCATDEDCAANEQCTCCITGVRRCTSSGAQCLPGTCPVPPTCTPAAPTETPTPSASPSPSRTPLKPTATNTPR